jgi:hypothetical protein
VRSGEGYTGHSPIEASNSQVHSEGKLCVNLEVWTMMEGKLSVNLASPGERDDLKVKQRDL